MDSIIVGNESLTLSRLSKGDLISYIRQVKRVVPTSCRVSTAESWSVWSQNTDLVKEVDFVVAHFYPSWENHAIDGAASYVIEKHRELQGRLYREYPGRKIEIVIGETGWPSGGIATGKVVPGGPNQRKFIEEFMPLAYQNAIQFYYFSAFDEEWKWQEGGSGTGKIELPKDRTFAGRWPGSSWGIYQSDGKLKSGLAGLFNQPGLESRLQRDIMVAGQLATYYDVGVDSSNKRRDWLSKSANSLQMSYPVGEQWGTVFITVGAPSDPPRPWKDFSGFSKLSVELRGGPGADTIDIGLKDAFDPDDGREARVKIGGLSAEWKAYEFPLASFTTADLRNLYVVIEFVFSGPTAQTVYVRNVRYLP